jgi:hypothetical protein
MRCGAIFLRLSRFCWVSGRRWIPVLRLAGGLLEWEMMNILWCKERTSVTWSCWIANQRDQILSTTSWLLINLRCKLHLKSRSAGQGLRSRIWRKEGVITWLPYSIYTFLLIYMTSQVAILSNSSFPRLAVRADSLTLKEAPCWCTVCILFNNVRFPVVQPWSIGTVFCTQSNS